MKLTEVIENLGLQQWNVNRAADLEVSTGFCSDLLSHVLGNAKPGSLWLTCQAHRNVVAVASLKDLAGIVVVDFEGEMDDDLVDLANKEGIALLSSELNGFELSGELFKLLFAY